MKHRLVINDAIIILPGRISEKGYVVCEDGIITQIGQGYFPATESDEIINAGGLYVSPGFIDMHTHGAGGYDFMDGTVEAYLGAAKMHAKHGTTSLLPTTLTSTNEELL